MLYGLGPALLIAALTVALPLVLTAQTSETQCVTQNASPAEQLAVLDADHICPRIVLINRFRTLLQRIARRCQDGTPTRIGDHIVTARQLLYEGGVEVGYLEITEALDQLTRGKTESNCEFILALYVTQGIG